MRIMAIDYGDARTGVALSDPTGFLAGQTFLIKSRKQEVVLEELAALVQRQGAQELVMGYPRNMDGTLGAPGGEVRRLCPPAGGRPPACRWPSGTSAGPRWTPTGS